MEGAVSLPAFGLRDQAAYREVHARLRSLAVGYNGSLLSLLLLLLSPPPPLLPLWLVVSLLCQVPPWCCAGTVEQFFDVVSRVRLVVGQQAVWNTFDLHDYGLPPVSWS